MLTFVESISLAGDRAKQNDDACGFSTAWVWVIDGATDLHDKPLTSNASDASWLARYLNVRLHEPIGDDAAERVRRLSRDAAAAFADILNGRPYERWQSPTASLLMIKDSSGQLHGADLGDCRVFVLDADGAAQVKGGPAEAVEAEAQRAAQQTDAHKPLLERTETLARLRRERAAINREGSSWSFCLDPACGDHMRVWRVQPRLPAHVLLMTDGFSALCDRYRVYDPAGLVRAALDRGLQELGRELRAIETADAAGARHPRFKRSDDATALLMRLT
jgi:hypothetical protein